MSPFFDHDDTILAVAGEGWATKLCLSKPLGQAGMVEANIIVHGLLASVSEAKMFDKMLENIWQQYLANSGLNCVKYF